ncbi:MAG: amidohydrolase family protein [bacterium]|jgi:5-methylthioadenosine/S-adenosylhomocysteine deaminase|nr:amidohydrolase family protein [Betaproteobacteria bacterium]
MAAETDRQAIDLLVRNIDWLVTVDPGRRIIRDAALAVHDGRFVDVGKTAALDARWQAARVVDGAGAVVMPGFVDNHLHSSFQLARGLADESNAQAFLFEHMYPYEVAMGEEDVRIAVSLAAVEMLRHGVTCYIEPGNYHPDTTVDAVMGAGMRAVLAVSCFDKGKSVTGLMPPGMIDTTRGCIEKTEALFEKYPGRHSRRLTVSASFRGMNNSSDELILALKGIAQKHDAILQTHACYSYFTHDASVAQYGKPEIERLESLGVLDERMLLLHGGWFEPHEIEILARRRPTVVCCPSSSLHNGYGNLKVGMHPELAALGVNVSLGCDHASSGTVDIVQEMRNCVGAYKELRLNPRVMPPEQAVEMATLNGARGAGLADRIGSIEVGKEADFVLFDAMTPEWQPLYNPVSNLVYSATGNTVKDVFVAGEQVVRNGHLTRIDEAALMREVVEAGRRITSRLDMKKVMKLRWPVE